MGTVSADPPAAPRPPTVIEALPTEVCWARLRAATVARVAHVLDGRPHVSVVNLAVEDGDVLVRSSRGSRLHAALARPGTEVAIEVDQLDEQTRTGWSVVARGTMSPVTDLVETARLDRTHPASWLLGDHGGTWLRLHVTDVSGRRLS